MNKIFRNGYLAALALVAMATLNACTDEYEYDAAGDTDNSGAYLSAEQTDIIKTEFDDLSFTFTVERHDTEAAATYKLYASNEAYSVPSEVSFEAGEKSKEITVSFNVPVGTIEDKVVIGVEAEDAYMYGAQSLTFTISRCELLTGSIFYSQLFGGYWPVDVYLYGYNETENSDGSISSSARYMIKDPFSFEELGLGENALNHNIIFSLNQKGTATLTSTNQSLFYVDATISGNPEAVGEAIISGNGTYYKEESMIDAQYNFSAANFVLFPWNVNIGTTRYGFGTVVNALIFPMNFDPIKQQIDPDFVVPEQ